MPGFAGDLPRERLVRLFELKTWRGINVILFDLCGF
jgi:hypothetical protein